MITEKLWAPVAGKYGRTRDGRKVGPMKSVYADGNVWSASGHAWHKDGSWDPNRWTPLDLIAEWSDVCAHDQINSRQADELHDFMTGDHIIIRASVARVSPDRQWPMVKFGIVVVEVDPTLVTSHERSVRPLKVGDRVLFREAQQTVVALDHGTAWVRDDVGVGQLCSRYELCHVDGRAAA